LFQVNETETFKTLTLKANSGEILPINCNFIRDSTLT